ncbi:hypothetical protein CMI40_01565 [Candidatus Pacearchaeota archaeon]|jgi:hypothetical protein|nr:hypothetical protein [Candidatus Pacearchaeota archaeon]|tara:strand:- start:2953 stop:3411 length:459 start_codon:yes stop_codon:yes gene_type:complete
MQENNKNNSFIEGFYIFNKNKTSFKGEGFSEGSDGKCLGASYFSSDEIKEERGLIIRIRLALGEGYTFCGWKDYLSQNSKEFKPLDNFPIKLINALDKERDNKEFKYQGIWIQEQPGVSPSGLTHDLMPIAGNASFNTIKGKLYFNITINNF